MRGATRVEFMPIKDGDVIDISGMERHTTVHQVGFKPGPARSRSGWLVLLVHEGEFTDRSSLGSKPIKRTIPKSAEPKKLRGPRNGGDEGKGRVTNRRLDMRLRENRQPATKDLVE